LKLSANTFVSSEKQASSFACVSGFAGSPVTAGPNEFQGSSTIMGAVTQFTSNTVFGMSVTDFQSLDQVVKPASKPTSFGGINQFSIIYYNGNLTIDPAGAVPNNYVIGPNGIQTGILIGNGNFTMNSTSAQQNAYYGLVYVTGSVNLNGSSINGALIMDHASGGVTLAPVSGIQASINYNPNILTALQTQVSGYLEDISARKKFLAIPNY
jgi:hypothetical protein